MRLIFKCIGLFCIFVYIMQADAYIAKGITPTKLYAIRVDNMTGPERTMIGTLQGIIADTSEAQIYIRPLAGGYDTWLEDLVNN